MSDHLQGLLGSLRLERMDRIADDKIRARLENAWSTRQQQRSLSFRLRRLAPVLATGVLLIGLGTATLSASGDSALYGLRVAIEDAAIALHTDPEDRSQYVVALLEQRQAEAARLEAAGNAAAASTARQIEQDTLRIVRALVPESPRTETLPAPAPTESPTPTPSPTPSPTVAPSAVATTHPATPRPTAPPPEATPTPAPVRTATPSPAPTGPPIPVTVTGRVKNPDGTPADAVCVMLQTGGGCVAATALGQYQLTLSGRVNQTVTLYFTRTDAGVLFKGTASAIVKGGTLMMPDVRLAK